MFSLNTFQTFEKSARLRIPTVGSWDTRSWDIGNSRARGADGAERGQQSRSLAAPPGLLASAVFT